MEAQSRRIHEEKREIQNELLKKAAREFEEKMAAKKLSIH